MTDSTQSAKRKMPAHSKPVVAASDARPAKRTKTGRSKIPVNPAAPAPLKLREYFHMKRAQYIYDNWDLVWEDEGSEEAADDNKFKRCNREGFGKYLSRAKQVKTKDNDDIYYVEVTYKKSWHGYGRWTAHGAAQQNMHRAVRHTIAGDLYHDIDMVCSIYSHFAEYCKRMDLPCAGVFRDYVDNRPRLMKEFMEATGITDDEEAKKELTKIPNGGKPHEKAPAFVQAIVEAVDALSAHIKETYPQYWEIAQYMAEQNKTAGKYYNPPGSLLSLFYRVLENDSWEALRGCTVDQKWSNKTDGVAAHDGTQLRIGPKTPANQDEILTACRQAILDKTGHVIALKIKPMNQRIPIPDDDDLEDVEESTNEQEGYRITDGDNEAADVLYDMMKDDLRYNEGRMFARKNGIWVEGEKLVTARAVDVAISSKMYTIDSDGCRQAYCNMKTAAKNVADVMMYRLPNHETPGFITHLWDNTIGKLVFLDGYVDFNLTRDVDADPTKEDTVFGRFIEGFAGVDSVVQIRRKFPRERNKDIEKQIDDKILEPITATTELRNLILHVFARAIAGHVADKVWLILYGDRNAGKGVLLEILKAAIDMYFCSFNLEALNKVKADNQPNAAKANSWLAPAEFRRWLASNEGELHVLSGSKVKKATSGGDPIQVEKKYVNEYEMKLQATLGVCLNDVPKAEPEDAFDTALPVTLPRVFISKEAYDALSEQEKKEDRFRVGDVGIKAWCRQPEVADAFIHILLDAYKPYPVKSNEQIKDSLALLKTGGAADKLDELFERTRNPTDVLHIKHIEYILTQEKIPMSTYKFCNKHRIEHEKNLLGVPSSGKASINGKQDRAVFGIKIKSSQYRNILVPKSS